MQYMDDRLNAACPLSSRPYSHLHPNAANIINVNSAVSTFGLSWLVAASFGLCGASSQCCRHQIHPPVPQQAALSGECRSRKSHLFNYFYELHFI